VQDVNRNSELFIVRPNFLISDKFYYDN